MSKKVFFFVFVPVTALLLGFLVFYFKHLPALRPVFFSPKKDITELLPSVSEPLAGSLNQTGIPLKLPEGFGISVLAKNLAGARVLAFDQNGNLWVSQTKEGKVSQILIKDGKIISQTVRLSGLKNPHGLAFDPNDKNILYIAEETQITKVDVSLRSITLPQIKILDLLKGGRHTTRTLGFGPDGRLYVSIGSSCDVCFEKDDRFGSLYSLKKDGSDFKPEAKGLRNTVFFVWDKNGKMWGTDMGRDNLGDNLPPDEINIIEALKDYGWPVCYGQNINDRDFDKNTYIQNPCNGKIPPVVELPAHSAPLGLAFVPEDSNWPDKYKNNLLVAFHGSWNRSEPTGYKVSFVEFQNGKFVGLEDFVSGWLASDGKSSYGRPVDLVFGPDKNLYISDDKAGVIYKVVYLPEAEIVLDDPKQLENISSPLKITGKARGNWFFEGSFPIKIFDGQNELVGLGIAQAQGDWMTNEFVSFSATVEFKNIIHSTGYVVFENDNPSGLPENQKTFTLPVTFK